MDYQSKGASLRAVFGLVMWLTLAGISSGCKGEAGPTGPQGPAGLQGLPGPPGPGTRIVMTATINSAGSATATLPTAVGNNFANPPVLACYMASSLASGVWSAVSDGYQSGFTASCGLVLQGVAWVAVMIRAIPGWVAAFVVVY